MHFFKELPDRQKKNLKCSKEKVEEISQQQYKKAMKHVERFNEYEKGKYNKQVVQKGDLDAECTFKPCLISQKYRRKSPKIKDYMNLSSNFTKDFLKQSPQIKQAQSTQRLLNWGRNRDTMKMTEKIKLEVGEYNFTRSLEKEVKTDVFSSGEKSKILRTQNNSLNITSLSNIAPLSHRKSNNYADMSNFFKKMPK